MTGPRSWLATGGGTVRTVAAGLGVLLLLAVAVGLLWAALAPAVAGWSDGVEDRISPEVTFAGLGLIAGLGVAGAGLVRPGRHPVAGAVVRLVGSVPASLLAWGVGRLAGAPVLAATGVLILWPLACGLTTALVTLALVLVHPEGAD
ncbi:MAG TPA: hypothetical protein VI248_12050 [Kineosporiaceae bacterium]